MNTIYKVVWNDLLNLFQVVNELTRSRGKKNSINRGGALGRIYEPSRPESVWKFSKTKLSAALLAAMLAVPGIASAKDVTATGYTWNIGTNNFIGEVQLDGQLEAGDTLILELATSDPQNEVYTQDNPTSASPYLVNSDFGGIDFTELADIVFVVDGKRVEDGSFVVSDGNGDYHYTTSIDILSGRFYVNRKLERIDLTNNLSLTVSQNPTQDNILNAQITGSGNIAYQIDDSNPGGWLTIGGDTVNDYTGRTTVGGTNSAPTTIVFGKHDAFGDTANLDVAAGSTVKFAGWEDNTRYTQTVHGLTGQGTLNLGSAAELTLKQTSTANGYVENKQILIDNEITGSGDSLFHIDLTADGEGTSETEGYEVVFTDDPASTGSYTGKIQLEGGYVTAFKKGDQNNQIIAGAAEGESGATLELLTGGQLAVDGTGEVNNLIIKNAKGWTSSEEGSAWSQHNNAIRFENLDLGSGKLTVQGDLTLTSNATVSVDNINTSALEEGAQGMSILDADEGIYSTIIKVVGSVNADNNKLYLDGNVQSQAVSIEQEDAAGTEQEVAQAVWDFDDELTLSDNGYDVGYRLTELKLTNEKQNYELTADKDGDLNALLSGLGGLTVNGGKTVTLGGTAPNTYEGGTVVEGADTTLVLDKDQALGASAPLSVGTGAGVVVGENVQQTVSELEGEGWVRIDDGADLTLETEDTNAVTVSNDMQGTGTFTVDLDSENAVLSFAGTQTGFEGSLFMEEGTFSLTSEGSKTFAQNAGIRLGKDSGNLSWEYGSTIGSLTLEGGNQLTADKLVIGGDPSLTVNGDITLNGSSQASASVEVADNIALVDFDNAAGYDQSFIAIGEGKGSISGSGAVGFTVANGSAAADDRQTVTLGYTQNGKQVANTTWTIADALKGSAGDTALSSNVLLTGIEILGDLTIAGTAGETKDLTAQVTGTGSEGHITFSGGTINVGKVGTANTYTFATTVAQDTTVNLVADSAFGRTQSLTAAGDVVLEENVEQWIGGLSGAGGIALNAGSVLTLEQTGAASIGNVLTGTGTFAVDLGLTTNALVFTEGNTSSFSGTFALTDLTYTLSAGSNADVAEHAKYDLGAGAVLNADAEGGSVAGLTFSGGTLAVGAVNVGDTDEAKLTINGNLVIGEVDGTVTSSGINLVGAENILLADDGVVQTVAHYTGDLTQTGSLTAGSFGESEIKNTGGDKTVAYAVWNPSSVSIDTSKKNVNLSTQLTAIELADAETETGLILDGTGGELSAVIRDHDTEDGNIAGTITFSGTSYKLSGDAPNTYTGITNVTSGTVTAAKDSAFGLTKELNLKGGTVDLAAYSQTVGALNIAQAGELTGGGALTIGTTSGGSSLIEGTNAFSGAVTLTQNHTLTMDDVAGLGTSGAMTITSGSNLVFDNADGNYSRDLAGDGLVSLINESETTLTGKNGSYTGDFSVAGGSVLTAAGTADDGKSADELLGAGGNIALDDKSSLVLSQAGAANWAIDNSVSGAGTIVVNGTMESTTGEPQQTFGFSTDWTDDFEGTLSLSNIRFAVGTSTGTTYGANNAANMANADAAVNGGAVLDVETGDKAVDTFDTLTLSGGTVHINGTAGFNTSTNELAQLVVNSLEITSGSVLDVALPSQDADMAGTLAESDLLLGSNQDAFQTLIATGADVEGIENLKLSDGSTSGTGLRQAISDGTETVAYGIYDWTLGLSSDETDVGIGFDLTEVAIVDGKTLTLTGATDADTLDVLLSGDSGNLSIASGTVNLTYAGRNTYGGTTTVAEGATLTAVADALGKTSWLTLNNGSTYENRGSNTVGGLTGTDGSVLALSDNTVLTLAHAGENADASSFAGKLTGSGDIAYESGTFTVTENTASDWTGTVTLGKKTDGKAQLNLVGGGALAGGSIALIGDDSVINITDSTAVLFSNEIDGQGTIKVDLGGADNAFAFTTSQNDLDAGSSLILQNAGYSLSDAESNNAAVAEKLAVTIGAGAVLSNDGAADKNIWGLTLSGGELSLGIIDSQNGQLNLSGDDFEGSGVLTITDATTVSFAESEETSGDRYSADLKGEALLSGGGTFELDILTGVTNLVGDVSNLHTDSDFTKTNENYYQNIGADGEAELVAKLYRGGAGEFHYDAETDKVYMTYGIRRIDLKYTGDGYGLTLNAADLTDQSGVLNALVAGDGNIVFAGGNILVSDLEGDQAMGANTYTGATYVRDGAVVTLGKDSAFGNTKLLDVEAGGTVNVGAGIKQTVGDLAGSGAIKLGADSALTLDYSGTAGSIRIGNAIAAADGLTAGETASFVINGAYLPSGSDEGTTEQTAELEFTNTAADLSKVDLTLENLTTRFDADDDVNYSVLAKANSITLAEGTDLGINAAAGESYELKTLAFDGGNLSFSNATLTPSGDAQTGYVLDVGNLVIDGENGGTLSVSAEIGSAFNILEADDDTYAQTLIHYDHLSGDVSNLKFDADSLDASAINNAAGKVAAYVTWQGVGENDGVVHDEDSHTIGLEYQVNELQLALAEGEGFVVSAGEGASRDDLVLSAKITDYGDTAGTITYAGGNITVTGENDYTGITNVTKDTVTLGNALGFGQTQMLNIAADAGVDIVDYSVTLGGLTLAENASLTGSDQSQLTLGLDAGKTSVITGAHGYAGDVALANSHTLTMNDVEGLGTSGVMTIASGSNLVFDNADGDYSRDLAGEGLVSLINGSETTLTGKNGSFTGDFSVAGGSVLTAAGTAGTAEEGKSADDLLGAGGNIALDDKSSLVLSQAGTAANWSIDNSVSGVGTIVVNGTTGEPQQTFGFSTDWTNDFTGTLSLSNIRFAVGTSTGSTYGANNAANMANADALLNDGAVLAVETGDEAVDAFKTLTVNDGASVEFDGTFAIGAKTKDFAQLIVDKLTLESGANIVVDLLPATSEGSNAAFAGTIAEGRLHASAEGVQTLISQTAGDTINLEGVLLNGESGQSTATQRIANSANEEVATGFYRYGLTTSGSVATQSLGIGYDLYRVDIDENEVLTLSESEFDEQFTGAGGLTIAAGKSVTLTHSDEGNSTYSGDTTVLDGATLTMNEKAASAESKLILADGANYINAGDNTVNGITAAAGSNLQLNDNDTLSLTHDADSASTIAGTVSGNGNLLLLDGSLTVANSVADAGYTGDIVLGTADVSASMTLKGTDGLGSGTISFGHSGSNLFVTGTAGQNGTTLTNTVSGSGTITVTLGSGADRFSFAAGQAALGEQGEGFTGTLALVSGTYDLTTDGGALKNATLRTGGTVIVNDAESTADRTIGGLMLAGGDLRFGTLATGSDAGQIVTGSLAVGEGTTSIHVALGSLEEADGASAFDAGTRVTLIEGYEGTVALGSNVSLDADDSKSITQTVMQGGTHVANFKYTGGKLDDSQAGHVDAVWDLSEIELVSSTGNGFSVSAENEESGSGTISALISGTGNITYAGGNVTVSHENTYVGTTQVTGGTLNLTAANALGADGNDLTASAGSVNFNGYAQTIGKLTVADNAAFTADEDAVITLTSKGSVIAGANAGAAGTMKLAQAATLELQNAHALGSMTLSLAKDAVLILDGFGSKDAYGQFGNLIDNGTVQIGGDAGVYVELTNHESSFALANVLRNGHLLLNNVEEGAMFDALTIAAGGSAVLNGNKAWTLDEALTLAQGATLSLSAGGAGNAINFQNQTASNILGTIAFTDAALTLGGVADSAGAANAAALQNSQIVAGSGFAMTVETGEDAQQLDGLTLSGGNITFAGKLGLNVDTTALGRLDITGVLDLTEGGTISVAADESAAVGAVDQSTLLTLANEGTFEALITAGSIAGDANDVTLSGATAVTTNIMDGTSGPVAEGTFSYSDDVRTTADGAAYGVVYGLTAVNILTGKTLTLTNVGDNDTFDALISNDEGAESLTINGDITLTNGDNNYTTATIVKADQTLTAEEGALGQTSGLTVEAGGAYVNAGDNAAGGLWAVGTVTIKEGTVFTIDQESGDKSTISGALTGEGSLAVTAGALEVSSSNAGYSGSVTAGDAESGAAITVTAVDETGGVINGLGSGTVNLANSSSELAVDVVGSASRTYTLSNTVEGTGTVRIAIETDGTAAENSAPYFSFNEAQGVFKGTILIEEGGYSLAYPSDASGQPATANQTAASQANVVVENDGKLYVSTNVNPTNRYVNKHVGSLTLAGGDIYFGGLYYGAGMASTTVDGGQLILGGEKGEEGGSGVLTITSDGDDKSTVHLGDGATNTISEAGSEVLLADKGAQIDFIQGAESVIVNGTDLSGVDSAEEANSLLNAALDFSLDVDESEQTISQYFTNEDGETDSRVVAIVDRVFGDGSDGSNQNIFGVRENADGTSSLYLNYRVNAIELLCTNENAGLVVTGSAADDTLGAAISGVGNIVFRGTDESVITLGRENKYSGKTYVESGTIAFAADNAFGKSDVIVSDGAVVNLMGFSQSVPSITAEGDDALTGGGSYELKEAGGHSSILGANTGFYGTVTVSDKHTLTIGDVASLGVDHEDNETLAKLDGSGATLEMAGVSGTFKTDIAGEGTVSLVSDEEGASNVVISTADVAGFTGRYSVAADSQLTLENKGESGWTFSNTTAGTGTVAFAGAGDFSFAAADQSDDFAGGTYIFEGLENALLTVSVGKESVNDENLRGKDAVVGSGAVLDVEAGGATIGGLTFAGGTLAFEGAYTPGETTYDGALTVTDFSVEETSTVAVKVDQGVNPDYEVDVNDSLSMTDIFSAEAIGSSITLVTSAAGSVTDEDLNGLTLDVSVWDEETQSYVAAEDSSVVVSILSSDESKAVADGTYGFKLAAGEKGTSLDLAYGLTGIAVYGGETLELTGADGVDNTLSAVVSDKDETAGGHVSVLGGHVTLEAQNSYSGATTVKKNATLTALAGGLGKTSSLVVAAGATYENAGDNAAGGIDVAETGTLLLTSGTLTLDMASGEEGTIAGAIEGAGNLTVSAGDVSVSGANSDYSGATTVTAGGTIAADDIDALGTGTINADDGTIAFTLGTPASGTGYTLDNAVAGGKNGTIRVDLSAAAGTKFAFSSTEESSFSGVLHLIGADFTLDAAATANQSVADGATLVLGDGAALHVSSSVIDPTHDFHDRYVSGLVLEKGSTVSFGGLVYNPNSNNKTYGGQLNLSGGELDLSRLDEGEKALIHLEEGATNYLGDGAELLVADDTAQINIFENAGGIVLRADSSDLNDYLALDVDDSSNPQTISQQIEEGGEYVEVAEVTREFGEFGSAEHAADGGTHTDVYLEYTVTNLNLTYTGDGNGLHVANTSGATGDEADLKMQVTGEGNIVFAGGNIVMGAAGGAANTYKGATYVNAGQVTAAKSGAFGETKYLAVAKNAAVDFAGFDQTVKTIASAGSLASTARATLTIGADDAEVRSSYVNGENAGLHADVNLLGSGHTLTINDGAALGDGTLTLNGNALVIAGAGSADAYDRLTNKSIEGTGTITASGSRIVIDQANGFQGTWTAEAGTTGTADAADLVFDASAKDLSVAEIIGEDSTVAIGENAAATMIENVGWTLTNNVSGRGELFLSAGGRGNEFSFAASGDGSGTITGFTGTYHLSDLTLTLSGTTSDLAGDIVLEDGATATVGTGEWSLNNVAVEADGRLDFTGNLAPGRYDEAGAGDNQTALNADSHLSVDSLHLAAGAQIAVDLTGLTVDPSDKPGENVQLTAQDVLSEDSGSLLTVLATSKTEITNNGAVLVDPEGNAIDDSDQVKVDIVSQPDGVADAIGTYDYGLETSDDGTELGIAFKLTEVDLQSGRTLALSAAEGTGALKDNTLTAKLTGEGSLQITSGYVVLNNGSNDYQGATTVDRGATLEAAAGSLGENGLVAAGTYVNAGDNTTTTAVVSENGTFALNEGTTFTLNGTEGASEIAGNITGSGSLVVEDGASLAVTSGNAGYTGNTTVRGAGAVTASAADALGTKTTITVADEASQYVLDKVNGDVANSFAGKGTVGLAGSIVEFIGSNADFTGTFALEGSAMTVSSAAALGSGNVLGIAPQTGEAENTLTLSFAENADLATVIAGAVDAEKTGEGVISLESYAADGTFTVSAGGVNFTTFGTEDTNSALVIADGTSSSVKASSVLESLTLAGAESVFTVGGTASDHASAPISVLVRGETAVGGGTLNLGVDAGDSLTSGMIGNVLTTEDFSIEDGTINVNGLLDSDGWTVDRLVVNGTGEGSGTIFVNLLGEASGGAGADAWLVQAGESGDLSGLDLTLGNDDGIIDAGTYEWHLLEAENGAGYYLHAFNKGTGDIDGSEIREPAAGAQAALLMASQTAFDLSLHDHIGNTPYVDQLTGERKLTSLWMIQRGDWGEWNDMSGQLATDGKVHTTTIGGDLKSWVADSGCHVHLGLLGAYANADYDVESNLDNRKATGQFTGWSVGGYAAFKPAGMDGGFGSIQVRWNRFDNEAGLAGEKTYDYKSDGFSIQGELGWTKTLSAFRTFGGKTGFWRIEPHVRAHWNGVSSDAATDSRGRTYEVDGEGNILVRVGFRTTLDVTHSASPKFGDPSVRAYLEANYLRNTKEASVTMTNEYRTSTVDYDNSDMAEFRFGMEAQFNEHMHLWGELHRVTGDDDYESTGAMVGFKYLW